MNRTSETLGNNQQKWMVYKNGQAHYFNDLEYLNHLLAESEQAIKEFNKFYMATVQWDLEDIKEYSPNFYKMYCMVIESEINAIRRLRTYERIKDIRKNQEQNENNPSTSGINNHE